MTREEIEEQIAVKQSVLCIGLDTDLEKIPPHLWAAEDPIFEFNKAIIEATHSYAVAYKPNVAFYEAEGVQGWKSLEKTINYLNKNHPQIFTIADAKRGDIGNTSRRYAQAFFNTLNFNALTIAPYMGSDSVKPFLETAGKWPIVLGLTSNAGAADFQFSSLAKKNGQGQKFLFEKVLNQVAKWGSAEQLMFVVGATKTKYLQQVRKIIPHHFLLVPGVGAQGGSLQGVLKWGRARQGIGLLVNSSRGIIYKDSSKNFAQASAKEAENLQKQMKELLFLSS
jgi:orotidine-5'-phosphate decarboxylase